MIWRTFRTFVTGAVAGLLLSRIAAKRRPAVRPEAVSPHVLTTDERSQLLENVAYWAKQDVSEHDQLAAHARDLLKDRGMTGREVEAWAYGASFVMGHFYSSRPDFLALSDPILGIVPPAIAAVCEAHRVQFEDGIEDDE